MVRRDIPHACLGGFSLIELMVSIAIGLLVTVAVVQMFAANRATYQLDEGLARMQENARFAIDFLNREIRQAGNMGCTRNAAWFNNLNGGTPGSPTDFTIAIQGFDANGTGPGDTYTATSSTPSNSTGTWSPALDTSLIPGSDGTAGAIPGTDAIVIRRISSAPISAAPPYNSGAQLALSPPPSGNPLQAGQIAIITDCEKASVFQITNINATGTNITRAAAGDPGNQCVTWGATEPGCPPGDQLYGPGSEVSTVQTYAFYIARNPAGIPALYVASLLPGTGNMRGTELVEGVENMQIMYGVDNIDDSGQQGDVDQYMTAREVDAAGLWPDVVNARISLLMSTMNTTGAVADLQQDTGTYFLLGTDTATAVTVNPFDDNRRRRVFSTTILLRNRGA